MRLPHEPLGPLEPLALAHGGSALAHVARFVPNCLCCYALLSRCLSGATFKERVDAHLEAVESHLPSATLDFYMSAPFVLYSTSAPDFVLSRLAVSQWVRDLTVEGIEPNPGPHPLFVLFLETFLGSLVSAFLTIHVFTPLARSPYAGCIIGVQFFLIGCVKISWHRLVLRLSRALVPLFLLFAACDAVIVLDSWVHGREHLVPLFRPPSLLNAATPRFWWFYVEGVYSSQALRSWIRDLTREGVHPNPGPNYCEEWRQHLGHDEKTWAAARFCEDVYANAGRPPRPAWVWIVCALVLSVLVVAALYLCRPELRVRRTTRFVDPESLGRTAELLPFDPRYGYERARVVANGEVLPILTTARTDFWVSPTVRGRVVRRRESDTVLVNEYFTEPTGALAVQWPFRLWRWYMRIQPEPSLVYDYSVHNPGADEGVRFPRGRRVVDVGPLFAVFRAIHDGTTRTIIVAELSVGPSSRLTSSSDTTLALQSMSYNNDKLDPFTTKMTFDEADDARSRNETPILRTGLYSPVGPLMQVRTEPVPGRGSRVAPTPTKVDGPKTPESFQNAGPHAAIGNETSAVEESKTKRPLTPLVLCRALGGGASTGPHNDRTANVAAVIGRVLNVRTDGKFTAEHLHAVEQLAWQVRRVYGTVSQEWVEDVLEHFSRPGQKRNLESGTSQFYDRHRVTIEAFVKAERLNLKPTPSGMKASDPRNISSTPKNQLRGLLLILRLMDALKSFGCSCSGLTMDELNARVATIACSLAGHDFDAVVSADASRCDGRNGNEIRSATDIFASILCPDWTAEATAALHACFDLRATVGATPRGPHDSPIQYDQGNSRASGAPDTTFGNTLLMTLIATTVALRFDLPLTRLPEFFVCAGDDTLWRFGEAVRSSQRMSGLHRVDQIRLFKDEIRAAAEFWSQVFEFDDPPPQRETDGAWRPGDFVPFVGRLFYDADQPSSAAVPERVVASFNTSYSNAPIRDVVVGKGVGRFMTDPHSYPWAYFGAAVAAIARKSKTRLSEPVLKAELPYLLRDTPITGLQSIPTPQNVSICARTRALFHEDLPWADAGAFERHCMDWDKFSDPVAFYTSCPPLGIDNGIVDPAVTRVNGEWYVDPQFVTAEGATDLLNPTPELDEFEQELASVRAANRSKHQTLADCAAKAPDSFTKSRAKVERAQSRPKPNQADCSAKAKERRKNDRPRKAKTAQQ